MPKRRQNVKPDQNANQHRYVHMGVRSKPGVLPASGNNTWHWDDPKGSNLPADAVRPCPACERNNEKEDIEGQVHQVRCSGFPPRRSARLRRYWMRETPKYSKCHDSDNGEAKGEMKIYQKIRCRLTIYIRQADADQKFNPHQNDDEPVEPFCGGRVCTWHAAILQDTRGKNYPDVTSDCARQSGGQGTGHRMVQRSCGQYHFSAFRVRQLDRHGKLSPMQKRPSLGRFCANRRALTRG